MACDVEVENVPSIMADEKAVEHTEGNGRHRKKPDGQVSCGQWATLNFDAAGERPIQVVCKSAYVRKERHS